jgi:hypothetical protein
MKRSERKCYGNIGSRITVVGATTVSATAKSAAAIAAATVTTYVASTSMSATSSLAATDVAAAPVTTTAKSYHRQARRRRKTSNCVSHDAPTAHTGLRSDTLATARGRPRSTVRVTYD